MAARKRAATLARGLLDVAKEIVADFGGYGGRRAELLFGAAAIGNGSRLGEVTPAADGYEIRVDGSAVPLANLEQAVLARALAVNRNMLPDEARADARIYLYAEPGAPSNALTEVLPSLARFKKIGIVAEDRSG